MKLMLMLMIVSIMTAGAALAAQTKSGFITSIVVSKSIEGGKVVVTLGDRGYTKDNRIKLYLDPEDSIEKEMIATCSAIFPSNFGTVYVGCDRLKLLKDDSGIIKTHKTFRCENPQFLNIKKPNT